MEKPVLSLKQFMLRTEILKLYRGYMKLGRFLNDPPSPPSRENSSSKLNVESAISDNSKSKSSPKIPSRNSMRDEWTHWVRSEFRLRQNVTTDEEMTRALLVHGKRQLQEMERTIMLATNRNNPPENSKDLKNNNNSS